MEVGGVYLVRFKVDRHEELAIMRYLGTGFMGAVHQFDLRPKAGTQSIHEDNITRIERRSDDTELRAPTREPREWAAFS